jgi:WhiB family redox-sensing transcriptional regulator
MTKPKYKDRLTEFVYKLQFHDISWHDEAACQSRGNEIFFADPSCDQKQIAEAKLICKGCEVRWKCLEFAVKNDVQYGVWGGFTPTERNSYRKGRIR